MNTVVRTALVFFSFLSLCICNAYAGDPRGGLSIEIHLYQEAYGYFFFPYLSTNSIAPSYPDGDYYITSPQVPTNGCSGNFRADTNGVSNLGGGASTYPTIDLALDGITNGSWSIWVTNATSTNVYTFQVSTVGIDNTFFPLGPAIVTYPIGLGFLGGDVNYPSQPNFTWIGPTNWTGQLYVNDNFAIPSGVDLQEAADTLPPSATNWPCPVVLPDGTNSFNVLYVKTGLTNFVSTTPVDASLNPISGWDTTGGLESSYDMIFIVGPQPVQGAVTNFGHTLVAYYRFDDTNSSGFDDSGNMNSIFCGASWGDPVHTWTTNAIDGGYAEEFFGGSAMTPCEKPLESLTNVMQGSFSVSLWVNTTSQPGNDDDDLADFSGMAVVQLNNNDHSTIPLGLTGSKGAFETGSVGGTTDTLHTIQPVNTGSFVHIVVTRDMVSGQKKIYVNGQIDNSDYGATGLLTGADDMTIGGAFFNGYVGIVDEVQFYAGVLGSNDVAFLYNNPGVSAPNVHGFDMQAHYDFDEGRADAVDVSKTGNDIILAGNFEGQDPVMTNDSIAGFGSVWFTEGGFLTPTTNLNSTIAHDFTISLWLKTTQNFAVADDFAYDGAGVVAADVPGGWHDTVPIALTGGFVAFNTGDGNNDETLHSTISINDGQWHHVAVTRNQNTGLKQIFIDGALDNSATGTTVAFDDIQTVTIGAVSDAGQPYPYAPEFAGRNGYEGLLDDMQIYSRALTADEIASLHSSPGSTITTEGTTNAPADFNIALNTTGLNWQTSGDSRWFIENSVSYDGVMAAQSGIVTNGQTSTLQTTITGPGTLSFYWKTVMSDFNFNIEFALDGNYFAELYYNSDWQQESGITIGPGQHTLTWIAHSADFSDPADAGFLDQVTLSPEYMPFITSDPSSQTVQLGSNVTFTAGVVANPPADLTWFRNGTKIPGETNNTLTITNAQFSDAGNYRLFASNSLGTASSGYAFLRVYQPTDLVPLSLTLPPVVSSLSRVPFVWSVTNTGPGAVSNYLDFVNFVPAVATPDFTQGTAETYFIAFYTPSGASYTVTNITRFPNIPAGTYTMALVVDANNSIIETNEDNNTLIVSDIVTVVNPDMQPGNLQITNSSLVGATINFSYNITNNGPGILDGEGWADELYYSKIPTLDNTAVGLRQISESPTLGVGEHTNSTGTVVLPIVPSGDYYIILKVDNFGFQDIGNIYEANESNNIVAVLVHLVGPDLVPTNLIVPATVSSGQPISAQWMIQNQGDGIATNFLSFAGYEWLDRLYISTNQQVDSSAVQLGFVDSHGNLPEDSYWFGVLPPGFAMTNTQSLTIPLLPAGNYNLIISADAANQVHENNETNNQLSVPVTVLNPDLMPTLLTAPPGANAHSTIPVSWTVTNRDAGTAYPVLTSSVQDKAWLDRIYISTHPVLDGTATPLGEFEWTNSVAAGTNYITTNMVTLPGLASGTYYLILLVDCNNDLYESNETNNTSVVSITVDSPDLAATGLIVPASVSSQQPISLVYSVQNLSSITAFPGWADHLYLSPHGIIESNNIPLGDFQGTNFFATLPLSPGSSYTNLINTAVPGVPAGDYYVLLQADGNQFFAEPTFANNLLAQPIHVSNPDLAVTNFNAPTSITVTQDNQRINVDWSVVNRGAGTAYINWGDYIYISPTNVLDTNAVLISSSGFNPPLAPGGSYSGFNSPTIPNGISGQYYLILQVNGGNALYESSYTNNVIVKPLQVIIPPLPSLQILSVSVPAEAWSGQQVEITWVLTNSGNAAVEGTFSDSVYLTTSPAGDNPQPYGVFPFTGEILPGQSVARTQLISLPISLSGTFWFEVQTDINRQIYQYLYRTNESLIDQQSMLVHLTPVPNLTITNIQSPTNAFSGAPVTVSWIVTNNGAGPTRAPYWLDAVYLSASTNFNDPTFFRFLGYVPNSAFLNAGDSYANSLTVNLPRGLDGTFHFVIQSDLYNYVFETNKADNVAGSGPIFIQLTPPPDLQVTTVNPPLNAFSGQPVSIQWAVTNKGLGQMQPSETGWADRVYISTNHTFDFTATSIADIQHSGPLNPDEGYATNQTVTLPVGISGDWYFFVDCDVFNNVYEGAFEDNNVTAANFATHVVLTPPPDLAVTILQAPLNALASHNLFVQYSVANQGSTQTPNPDWNDILFVCTNNVFDPNRAVLSVTSGHYGVLQAGSTYINTIGLTLPDEITGTYYLFVYSDFYKQVFELNRTNNLSAPSKVTITSQPADLTVSAFQSPPTANVTGTMNVSFTVTNIGIGDTAVAQWYDRLILSPNTVLGSLSDVVLQDFSHNGLLGTNSSYFVPNQTVGIPSSVSPGNYNLFLMVDAGGSVYEGTNEANNVYGPVPITITAHSADLLVPAASGPTNAFSGTTVPFSYTIKNRGDRSPSSSYWLDAVYLSPDGLVGPTTPLLGYFQNSKSLVPGDSYSQTVNLPLPADANGDYYFVVVADAFGLISEPGLKANNVQIVLPPVHITLSPTPDIVVTNIVAPATAYEGQPLTITWTVKNIGSAPASAYYWYDVAYLSLDQHFDPSTDTYLGFAPHPRDLGPGESYTNTATFTIPQGLSGPFELFVSTDSLQQINEGGSRLNNTAGVPIQIQLLPPVDLVAGLITIPANGSPGQNATVTYVVNNLGSNAALGSWDDSLYISADTNLDVSDPLFARTNHVGDIQPGGSYTNTITAALPGVVPGNYYVIVRSDIRNHLIESNKTNNIGASLNGFSLTLPVLTLGVPSTGTIGSGQSAYYEFNANAGDTIHIKLSSGAVLADNEIFVRFGGVPTTGNFDFAANNPFTSQPELFIPITQSGTYYLLLYTQYAPFPEPYSLLAEVLPFTVATIQPNFSGDKGQTTFAIQGALFDSTTQFRLANGSNLISSISTMIANSTLAYVTFSMTGVPDGAYDLQAALPASATNFSTSILSNAVTVFSGNGPSADVSLDGPLVVGTSAYPLDLNVLYGNSGDADLAAPLVIVYALGGTRIGLDKFLLETNDLHLLGRSLEGPSGIMRPQTSDGILIHDSSPFRVNAYTVTTTDSKPISDVDWQEIESAVRPNGVADANWSVFWTKIRTRVGASWGDYVTFLNSVALGFPTEQRDVRAMIGSIYTNQPGFQASSSLSGTVLGATDNLPQPGIEVTLFTMVTNLGSSPTLVAQATTDSSGQFVFPSLAAGQYAYGVDAGFSLQFDMDRDGSADTNGPSVNISSTSDLAGQTLYLYQPKMGSLTNDSDATLALDSQGTLHSFWTRNGGLWHATYNSGQWVDASMIVSNVDNAFAVASSPKLLDGSSPGLLLVWSQVVSNGTSLFYSVGQSASGSFRWSMPVQLTSDAALNANPSIAVRNDGVAIISYLKVAPGGADDTDVYWSAVNISSGALLWSGPAPSFVSIGPRAGSVEVDTNSISLKYDKSIDLWIGDQYDFSAKFKLSGKGSVGQCSASLAGSGGLDLAFTSPQYVFTGSGSLDISADWQINPDVCYFEFKDLTLGCSGSVHAQLNNAIPQLLGIVPALRPSAEAFIEMTDWLQRKGIQLQNSVSVGVGISFAGATWTQPPPPYQGWRTPDVPGKTLLVADAGLTIGLRKKGTKEENWNEVIIPDHAGTDVTTVNAFVSGPDGSGSYYGATGEGKVLVTWEIYPTFHTKNVSFSGTFKVSRAPRWSYTLPLGGTIVIGDKGRTPRIPGSDPLPAGWTFNYDPGLFVGTTNVWGTNSVLHNVGADLYQDGAPSLALDSVGTPYQAWYKNGDPYASNSGSQIYIADFNGNDWNDPVVIPNSIGLNKDVYAMTDSQGHRMTVWIHTDISALGTNATYQQVEDAHTAYDAYYSTFDGSNWSTPAPVASTAGTDDDLQLSRLSNGDILAIWVYTDSSALNHLVSASWNGSFWTAPSEIATGQISGPTAQQLGATTYLQWLQQTDTNHNTRIYQTSSSGSGWATPSLFDPPLPVAPLVRVPLPKGAIDDTLNGLKALGSVTIYQQKVCCKCAGHVTNKFVGPNQGCGFASIDYDYDKCLKTFTYACCVHKSSDPNDILGPDGFGPDHWVSALSPLNYRVDFFNDPVKASAAAKVVTITVSLDPNFDARSFRLGSFGFGGQIFSPPANTAFYQTRLDLVQSNGFYLDVFAGIDVINHQGFWTFTTIDPSTGDVPLSPTLGFLPPDTSPPNGEGFVSFSVLPSTGISNAVQVAEQASIVFDNQPPLPTAFYYNKLESSTPTSSVLPLPAVTVNPSFDVFWQGASAPNGDGIASFDIYVSKDGSPYDQWLEQTPLTQSTFLGAPGSTYSFYSLAHANSGVVELPHASADASIFVSTNAAPSVVSTNITVAPEQLVLLHAQASDINGDSFVFSLDTNAPAGANITTNGSFAWTPTRAFAETTNVITILATDDGLPPLIGSNVLNVIVGDYLDVRLGSTNLSSGASASVPIYVASSGGLTNASFNLRVPENLISNFTLTATAPQLASSVLVDQLTNLNLSFTATAGQSLQGTQQVALLTFTDTATPLSAIVTLMPTNISGFHTNGVAYSNSVANAGTVILVHTEPVVQAVVNAAEHDLLVYGRLGTNYEIQYTTTLTPPNWQPIVDYTQTNGVLIIPVGTSDSAAFYRLLQK